MPTNEEMMEMFFGPPIFGNQITGPFAPPGGFRHGFLPEFRFFEFTRPEPPVPPEIPVGTPGAGAVPSTPPASGGISRPGGGSGAPGDAASADNPGTSAGLGSDVNPGPSVVDARDVPTEATIGMTIGLPALPAALAMANRIGVWSGFVGPFGVVDPEVTPPVPGTPRFGLTVAANREARERNDAMDTDPDIADIAAGFDENPRHAMDYGLVSHPPESKNDRGGTSGSGSGRSRRSNVDAKGRFGAAKPGSRGDTGPTDPPDPPSQPDPEGMGGPGPDPNLHAGGLARGPDRSMRGEEFGARLLEGEFVFSRDAVALYGEDLLATLNRVASTRPEIAATIRTMLERGLAYGRAGRPGRPGRMHRINGRSPATAQPTFPVPASV